MNTLRLLARNLRYYARTNIVIAGSIAIATAVMSGALIVGDSINRSVYALVLAKVGQIDAALVSPTFFRAGLADELADELPNTTLAAIVHVRGRVAAQGDSASIPNVNMVGVVPAFWDFFDGTEPEPLPSGRKAAINAPLAQALKVELGDTLLATIGAGGAVPTDTLFAHKDKDDTVRTLRLTVTAILPASGAGAFSLENAPAVPPSVYVDRSFMTGRAYLNQQGKANSLLLRSTGEETEDQITDALRRRLTLGDYGVTVLTNAAYASIEAETVVLPPHVPEAAARVATALGAAQTHTSVYLANAAELGERAIHYFTVAGLDDGTLPSAALAEDELLLNAWAAEDLNAKVGDRVTLRWFLPDGSDEERSQVFRVAGVVPMQGPGADRHLVPRFEGISEFENIEDWDPPFAFDKTRISDRDETYWDQYGSAPKVFLALQTMERIWQGQRAAPRPDWYTSIRIAETHAAASIAPTLLAELDPQAAGLSFRMLRENAIEAARGTMDFGSLFASMSFFLVLAALGLAAMTTRVSLLRRARTMGLLLTQGFDPRAIRRLLRAEGLIIGLVGAAVGSLLAVSYAQGLLAAMTRWWGGAVPDTAIRLHIGAVPLASGAIFTLIALCFALSWGFRDLRRKGVLELLGGAESLGVHVEQSGGRLAATLFYGCTVPAILLALVAAPLGIPSQWAFIGSGFLLLIGGISGTAHVLRRALATTGRPPTSAGLALRNAASNRERSLLAVGLLAAACFIIVAVAVNKRTYSQEAMLAKDSGTGGFALRARSVLALPHALETEAGRRALGFSAEDEALFDEIVSCLMSAGDDVSCLNLAKPVAPRVLGASDALIRRGGFRFAKHAGPEDAPWQALTQASDQTPVIGDAASVQWQLHAGLGKTISTETAAGRPLDLLCVGMLTESIFQGELIVSEAAFREHFDAARAGRYYLIAPAPGREDAAAHRLRQLLGDYGLEVTPTHEILNTFIDVQNTYLAMFLILGGLGLLLGTFGMVAVLVRNALERRREFSVMLAMGFEQRQISRLLAVENAGLLIVGMLCGTIAALIAFIPHIASVASTISWGTLAAVLIAIAATGLTISGLTARVTTRGRLLDALRDE